MAFWESLLSLESDHLDKDSLPKSAIGNSLSCVHTHLLYLLLFQKDNCHSWEDSLTMLHRNRLGITSYYLEASEEGGLGPSHSANIFPSFEPSLSALPDISRLLCLGLFVTSLSFRYGPPCFIFIDNLYF